MAHALPLRAQIGDVLRVGGSLQGDPLGDVETEALEAPVLDRIVGHEAHGGDPEVHKHLGADAVLAAVNGQALLQVGVDGVVPLLLELVSTDLVAETDAAALVTTQIDEDAAAFTLDHVHRGVQLWTAVATQRTEHVAGEALRVDADE